MVDGYFFNVMDFGATGNGTTDDTTSIVAAIASIGSSGGTLFFPQGTYLVTGLIISNSGIKILGTGWKSIIKLKNASNQYIFRLTAGNIQFKDIQLDGNKSNQTSGKEAIQTGFNADNLIVQNVFIQNTYWTGIFVNGSKNTLIDGCRLLNCGASGVDTNTTGYGIDFESSTDWKVINCRIDTSLAEGIKCGGTSPYTSSNFVISNNTITNVQTDQRGCIFLFESQDGVISNNCLFGNPNATHGINGIYQRGPGGSSPTNNIISNNRIEDVSGVGIEIQSGGVILSGNRIKLSGTGSDAMGIYIGTGGDNSTIIGNSIENATQEGIELFSSASLTNVLINGNIIKNTQASGTSNCAIRINCSGSGTISHVTISNNQLYDDQSSPTQEYGILVTGSGTASDIQVFGNYFSGNTIANTSGLPTASRVVATTPLVIGDGAAGVDYDFLTVDGQSSDFIMKWYEDEKILKLNSDSNNIGMVFGNPSTDLFTIIGSILSPNQINGAGFSSEKEAAFFLESKGNSGILGGSVYTGLYNPGSAVTAGQLLVGLWGGGNDTTTSLPAAVMINMYSAATWTSTSWPSYIDFVTTDSGSVVSLPRGRFQPSGRLSLGSVTEAYPFFSTADQKLLVNNEITNINEIISILSCTSLSVNPSNNTSSGFYGAAVYSAQGFTLASAGNKNFTGFPVGLGVVTGESTSLIGGFCQVNDSGTGTLDGSTGGFFVNNHNSNGQLMGILKGGEFNANTDGASSPTGTVTLAIAGDFGVSIGGVVPTTAYSARFIEPTAYNGGFGTPSNATNRCAGWFDGTLGLARQDIASAASITNMAVESSYTNFTGTTATNLHGMHADSVAKFMILSNAANSSAITVKNQSGTEGTAANRFANPNATDLRIPPNGNGLSFYDNSASRWIPIMPHYTGQTYSVSNVTTDRSYDANSTTLDEIADVLGTLIADLRAAGVVI